jgi:peptide deformylase
MKYEIKEYPDPILTKPSAPVSDLFGTDELSDLADEMCKMVDDLNANGLAAPQIGLDLALVAYRNKYGINILCNPVILARSGKFKSYGEGCLSSPGFRRDIRRSKEIKVKARTIGGDEVIIKEKGFAAIVLQHEIDHINGVTLIGSAPDHDVDKKEYMRRLDDAEKLTG